MKPAPFEYLRPSSVDETLDLLAAHGDGAMVLAGGQSLVPLMNLRLSRPAILIDINRLDDLAYIRDAGDRVEIGALTRHSQVEVSDLCRTRLPLAHEAVGQIGYPAIRHRGTAVGSIAHADPVAEWPCLAMALDAEVTVGSASGQRALAATEFFRTYFTTARRPEELVVQAAFSTRYDAWGFREFARRRGDFAVVAAAVAIRVEDDTVTDARIALAGASDRPVRAESAEQAITGRSSGDLDSAADDAGELAAAEAEPLDDVHGSGSYRRNLVRHLTRKAVRDAGSRIGEES